MVEQTTLHNILTCVIAVIIFIFQSLNYIIARIKQYVKHKEKSTTVEIADTTISVATPNDNITSESFIAAHELIQRHFDIPLIVAEDDPKVNNLIESTEPSDSNNTASKDEYDQFMDHLIDDSYVARGLGLITATIGREAQFYLYSKYDNDFEGIVIELRGRNGEIGEITITSKNSVSPIESKPIPIEYIYDEDRIKVFYTVFTEGVHTLTLSRNNIPICRSPYYISVEKSPANSRSRIRLGTRKCRMVTKFGKGKHTPVEIKDNTVPIAEPSKSTVKTNVLPMTEETLPRTDVMSIITKFESKNKGVKTKVQKCLTSITEKSLENDTTHETSTSTDKQPNIETSPKKLNTYDNVLNICKINTRFKITNTKSSNSIDINHENNKELNTKNTADINCEEKNQFTAKFDENVKTTNDILQKENVSPSHQKDRVDVLYDKTDNSKSSGVEKHNETSSTTDLLEKRDNETVSENLVEIQSKIKSTYDEEIIKNDVLHSDCDNEKPIDLIENTNGLESNPNDDTVQQIIDLPQYNINSLSANTIKKIANSVCEKCSKQVIGILSELPRDINIKCNENSDKGHSNFETLLAQPIRININIDNVFKNAIDTNTYESSPHLQTNNVKKIEPLNINYNDMKYLSLSEKESLENDFKELDINNTNSELVIEQNEQNNKVNQTFDENIPNKVTIPLTEHNIEIDEEVHLENKLSENETILLKFSACKEQEPINSNVINTNTTNRQENEIELQVQDTLKSIEQNVDSIKSSDCDTNENVKNLSEKFVVTLETNNLLIIDDNKNINETPGGDETKLIIEQEPNPEENSNFQNNTINEKVLTPINVISTNEECTGLDHKQRKNSICETNDQNLDITTQIEVYKSMIEKYFEPMLNSFKNDIVEKMLQLCLNKDFSNENHNKIIEITTNDSNEIKYTNNTKVTELNIENEKMTNNDSEIQIIQEKHEKKESEKILCDEKTDDHHFLKQIEKIIKKNVTSINTATSAETKLQQIVNAAIHNPNDPQKNVLDNDTISENIISKPLTLPETLRSNIINTTIKEDNIEHVKLKQNNDNQIGECMEDLSNEKPDILLVDNESKSHIADAKETLSSPIEKNVENKHEIQLTDTKKIPKEKTITVIEPETTSIPQVLSKSETITIKECTAFNVKANEQLSESKENSTELTHVLEPSMSIDSKEKMSSLEKIDDTVENLTSNNIESSIENPDKSDDNITSIAQSSENAKNIISSDSNALQTETLNENVGDANNLENNLESLNIIENVNTIEILNPGKDENIDETEQLNADVTLNITDSLEEETPSTDDLKNTILNVVTLEDEKSNKIELTAQSDQSKPCDEKNTAENISDTSENTRELYTKFQIRKLSDTTTISENDINTTEAEKININNYIGDVQNNIDVVNIRYDPISNDITTSIHPEPNSEQPKSTKQVPELNYINITVIAKSKTINIQITTKPEISNENKNGVEKSENHDIISTTLTTDDESNEKQNNLETNTHSDTLLDQPSITKEVSKLEITEIENVQAISPKKMLQNQTENQLENETTDLNIELISDEENISTEVVTDIPISKDYLTTTMVDSQETKIVTVSKILNSEELQFVSTENTKMFEKNTSLDSTQSKIELVPQIEELIQIQTENKQENNQDDHDTVTTGTLQNTETEINTSISTSKADVALSKEETVKPARTSEETLNKEDEIITFSHDKHVIEEISNQETVKKETKSPSKNELAEPKSINTELKENILDDKLETEDTLQPESLISQVLSETAPTENKKCSLVEETIHKDFEIDNSTSEDENKATIQDSIQLVIQVKNIIPVPCAIDNTVLEEPIITELESLSLIPDETEQKSDVVEENNSVVLRASEDVQPISIEENNQNEIISRNLETSTEDSSKAVDTETSINITETQTDEITTEKSVEPTTALVEEINQNESKKHLEIKLVDPETIVIEISEQIDVQTVTESQASQYEQTMTVKNSMEPAPETFDSSESEIIPGEESLSVENNPTSMNLNSIESSATPTEEKIEVEVNIPSACIITSEEQTILKSFQNEITQNSNNKEIDHETLVEDFLKSDAEPVVSNITKSQDALIEDKTKIDVGNPTGTLLTENTQPLEESKPLNVEIVDNNFKSEDDKTLSKDFIQAVKLITNIIPISTTTNIIPEEMPPTINTDLISSSLNLEKSSVSEEIAKEKEANIEPILTENTQSLKAEKTLIEEITTNNTKSEDDKTSSKDFIQAVKLITNIIPISSSTNTTPEEMPPTINTDLTSLSLSIDQSTVSEEMAKEKEANISPTSTILKHTLDLSTEKTQHETKEFKTNEPMVSESVMLNASKNTNSGILETSIQKSIEKESTSPEETTKSDIPASDSITNCSSSEKIISEEKHTEKETELILTTSNSKYSRTESLNITKQEGMEIQTTPTVSDDVNNVPKEETIKLKNEIPIDNETVDQKTNEKNTTENNRERNLQKQQQDKTISAEESIEFKKSNSDPITVCSSDIPLVNEHLKTEIELESVTFNTEEPTTLLPDSKVTDAVLTLADETTGIQNTKVNLSKSTHNDSVTLKEDVLKTKIDPTLTMTLDSTEFPALEVEVGKEILGEICSGMILTKNTQTLSVKETILKENIEIDILKSQDKNKAIIGDSIQVTDIIPVPSTIYNTVLEEPMMAGTEHLSLILDESEPKSDVVEEENRAPEDIQPIPIEEKNQNKIHIENISLSAEASKDSSKAVDTETSINITETQANEIATMEKSVELTTALVDEINQNESKKNAENKKVDSESAAIETEKQGDSQTATEKSVSQNEQTLKIEEPVKPSTEIFVNSCESEIITDHKLLKKEEDPSPMNFNSTKLLNKPVESEIKKVDIPSTCITNDEKNLSIEKILQNSAVSKTENEKTVPESLVEKPLKIISELETLELIESPDVPFEDKLEIAVNVSSSHIITDNVQSLSLEDTIQSKTESQLKNETDDSDSIIINTSMIVQGEVTTDIPESEDIRTLSTEECIKQEKQVTDMSHVLNDPNLEKTPIDMESPLISNESSTLLELKTKKEEKNISLTNLTKEDTHDSFIENTIKKETVCYTKNELIETKSAIIDTPEKIDIEIKTCIQKTKQEESLPLENKIVLTKEAVEQDIQVSDTISNFNSLDKAPVKDILKAKTEEGLPLYSEEISSASKINMKKKEIDISCMPIVTKGERKLSVEKIIENEAEPNSENEIPNPVANIIDTLTYISTNITSDSLKIEDDKKETMTDIPNLNHEQTLTTEESLKTKNPSTEAISISSTSDIFQHCKVLTNHPQNITMTSNSKEFQTVSIINTNEKKVTSEIFTIVSENVQISSTEEITENKTEEKSKIELDDRSILSTKQSVVSCGEINQHEIKNQPDTKVHNLEPTISATSTQVSKEIVSNTQQSPNKQQTLSTQEILNSENQISESFPINDEIPNLEQTLKIELNVLPTTIKSKEFLATSKETIDKEEKVILLSHTIHNVESISREEMIQKETENPIDNEQNESRTFEVNTPKNIDARLKIDIQNEETLITEKIVSETLTNSSESKIVLEKSLKIENDTLSTNLNSKESPALLQEAIKKEEKIISFGHSIPNIPREEMAKKVTESPTENELVYNPKSDDNALKENTHNEKLVTKDKVGPKNPTSQTEVSVSSETSLTENIKCSLGKETIHKDFEIDNSTSEDENKATIQDSIQLVIQVKNIIPVPCAIDNTVLEEPIITELESLSLIPDETEQKSDVVEENNSVVLRASEDVQPISIEENNQNEIISRNLETSTEDSSKAVDTETSINITETQTDEITTEKSVEPTTALVEEINQNESKKHLEIKLVDPETIVIEISEQIDVQTVTESQASQYEQTMTVKNSMEPAPETFDSSESEIIPGEESLSVENNPTSMNLNSIESSATPTEEKIEVEVNIPSACIITSEEQTILKSFQNEITQNSNNKEIDHETLVEDFLKSDAEPVVSNITKSQDALIEDKTKIDVGNPTGTLLTENTQPLEESKPLNVEIVDNNFKSEDDKTLSKDFIQAVKLITNIIPISTTTNIIPEEMPPTINTDLISSSLNLEKSSVSEEIAKEKEANIEPILTENTQSLKAEKTLIEEITTNNTKSEDDKISNLTESKDEIIEHKLEVNVEAESSSLKSDDTQTLSLEDKIQHATDLLTENKVVDSEITLVNISTNIHTEVATDIPNSKDVKNKSSEEFIRLEKQGTNEFLIPETTGKTSVETPFEPVLASLNDDALSISPNEITKKEGELIQLEPTESGELRDISIVETIKKDTKPKVNELVESKHIFGESTKQASAETTINNQVLQDEQNILTESPVKIENPFQFSNISDTILNEEPIKTEIEPLSLKFNYEKSPNVKITKEVIPPITMMFEDVQSTLTEKSKQNKLEGQPENEEVDFITFLKKPLINSNSNLKTNNLNLDDRKTIIEDYRQPTAQVTGIIPTPIVSNETPIKESLVAEIEPVSAIINIEESPDKPVQQKVETPMITSVSEMKTMLVQTTNQNEIHPENIPVKLETLELKDSKIINTEISTNIIVSQDNITTSTKKSLEIPKTLELIVTNTLERADIEMPTLSQVSKFEQTESMKKIEEPESQLSDSIPISSEFDITSVRKTLETEAGPLSSTLNSEKAAVTNEINPDVKEEIPSTSIAFDDAQISSVEETIKIATIPHLEHEQIEVKTDTSDSNDRKTFSTEESIQLEKKVMDTILVSNDPVPIEVPLKIDTETASVTFISTELPSASLENVEKLEEKVIQSGSVDSKNEPVFSKKRILYISISSNTDSENDTQVSEDEQTVVMKEIIDSKEQISDTNSISGACGEPLLEEPLITEKEPLSNFENIPITQIKEENNKETQVLPSAQLIKSFDNLIKNLVHEEIENQSVTSVVLNDTNVGSINDVKSIGQEITSKIPQKLTKSTEAHELTNVETETVTDIPLKNVDEISIKVQELDNIKVQSSTISALPDNSQVVLSGGPFEDIKIISPETPILSSTKDNKSNKEIDTSSEVQISNDALSNAQESADTTVLPLIKLNKIKIETMTPTLNKMGSDIEKPMNIENKNNQKYSCSEKSETAKLNSGSFSEYGESSKKYLSDIESKSKEKSYGIQKLEMSVQRMKTSDDDYFEKTVVQLEQTEKISIGKNAAEDENNTAIDDKLYTVNESDLNAIVCASSLQEALTLLDTKIKFKFKHNNRKPSSKGNSAIHKPNVLTPTSSSSNKNANFTEARKFFKEMEKKSKK